MFSNIVFFESKQLNVKGISNDYLEFLIRDRLKDKAIWKKHVQPFRTKEDSDERWRGEFFGKEMRGAAMIYSCVEDEELYDVLTEAVQDLLSTQEDNGRFSTYMKDKEFFGWDMWCRKYVAVGLIYYYSICKDDEFKKHVLSALMRHIDYIIARVGRKEEGKIGITETSTWWGCVNSCTILEPVLELYKITAEQRYLDFAEYIISTGGSSECNLFELAFENKLKPFQYPITKAYEIMSFFEGMLAYYEITGKKEYLKAVENFLEAINETDMTLIGCAGCSNELFDNSSMKQTEPSDDIMQETCVTVTWMRLLSRLFKLSGNVKYIDRIEKSAINSLYGSVNVNHCKHYYVFGDKFVDPMPFDSYSPLYFSKRWRSIGGYLEFQDGGYCGCCVAIGGAGIALVPLTSVMNSDQGVIINYPFNCDLATTDEGGKEVNLQIVSDYPAEPKGKILIKCGEPCALKLFLRIPDWCEKAVVNGVAYDEGGYVDLSKQYCDGEEIDFQFIVRLNVHRLNGKTAFTYGAITLAGDEEKTELDLTKAISVDEMPKVARLEPQKGELIRLKVLLEDGRELLLTDYQSCGKTCAETEKVMTVWFNST